MQHVEGVTESEDGLVKHADEKVKPKCQSSRVNSKKRDIDLEAPADDSSSDEEGRGLCSFPKLGMHITLKCLYFSVRPHIRRPFCALRAHSEHYRERLSPQTCL